MDAGLDGGDRGVVGKHRRTNDSRRSRSTVAADALHLVWLSRDLGNSFPDPWSVTPEALAQWLSDGRDWSSSTRRNVFRVDPRVLQLGGPQRPVSTVPDGCEGPKHREHDDRRTPRGVGDVGTSSAGPDRQDIQVRLKALACWLGRRSCPSNR